MSDARLDFQNILVLNFGQLGDVILSLPVHSAIRQKFPNSKITIMCGKAVAQVVKLSKFSDEIITVDRVKLRDSPRLWSIKEIFKIIGDLRSRKFDFVIDVHSLSETNLLGFLTGAKKRLYGNREGRSLNFLSNFRPAPPSEDKSKHIADRYLDVLKPFAIENSPRIVKINPNPEDLEFVDKVWQENNLGDSVIGLSPGAGHPSRRWSLENFGALADILVKENSHQVVVFLGPEEIDMIPEIEKLFPKKIIVLDKLNLLQLIAALSKISIFVSNDTGPTHLAAAVGTPLVMLLARNDADSYHFSPLANHFRVLGKEIIDEISPESVHQAIREVLNEVNEK